MVTISSIHDPELLGPRSRSNEAASMRNTLIIAIRFTITTTILLGIFYPLLVTGLGHRLGDPGAQPCRQRGRAELLGRDRGVQQLADVAQIGHPALAIGVGEHPCGQVLGDDDRLEQRRDPAHPQHP